MTNPTITTSPKSFYVQYRNYGHWDIVHDGGRIFCIRGGPGHYFVRDERPASRANQLPSHSYKTVGACMAFITDELMYELIVAEGQTPTKIESWNIL